MKIKNFCFMISILIISCFISGCQNGSDDLLKFTSKEKSEDNNLSEKDSTSHTDETGVDDSLNKNIIVHVSGNVKRTGVYELNSEDRVIDAIKKAGGFTADADSDSLNLAEKVKDGMKIYVPSKEEKSASVSDESSGKFVDLNLATKEELMTLPGVGEKTADKIIKYREKEGFNSVNDLLKVSGFGKKKMESLKGLISVGGEVYE